MISVVIPVLNEAALVGPALEALLRQPGDYEVIVADGGSRDGTCDVLRSFPVQVVPQPPGAPPDLAGQINRGARAAHGGILVLLHIDVQLPPSGLVLIEAALADPGYVGGGFIPAYDGPVPDRERRSLALVERTWQTWTRLFRTFAGDTAPFVRSEAFWRGGGYPPACFAADWDFADRLRRLGRLRVIPERALVHNRRLVQNGVFKTLLVTWSIWGMYCLGVDRAFLARWYRRRLPKDR